MYDVVVVGAGVSGCAVARELARYDCSVCVVERDEDVCCGTSKANSAIVHAGYDAQPGSLMARLNVWGNELMYQLADELDFRCERRGSLVVCVSEETRDGLRTLLERGEANGVPGLRIIERDELRALEPSIADEAVAALWAPTGGIVDPFELCIAMAENACANGVEFRFGSAVDDIARDGEAWAVTAGGERLVTRCVVNAAGVHCDDIRTLMASCSTTPDAVPELVIIPRKGEYYLLDTTASEHVRHTIFTLPTAMGKGVLVSPTVHGNLIVGPTATDVDDKGATDTTDAGLAEVAEKCSRAVRDVPLREVITTFAGLRAHQAAHDFLIGEVPGAEGLFDCAAIESPGLTSCPAIGALVAGLVRERLGLRERAGWVGTRHAAPDVSRLSLDEWDELCARDGRYGNVICRCRRVSEAQIVDAIHRPLGARSLDAVKRRSFATAGRCQGGFCTPKIMEILERELGMAPEEVSKCGPGSELVVGTIKDRLLPDALAEGGGERR